jgi:hypothetical protein
MHAITPSLSVHGLLYYVPSLLEMPKPSIKAFMFHVHLQCNFMSLHFYSVIIHCNIFGSRIAKPSEYFVLHITVLAHVFLCFEISPACRVVELNPDFLLDMSTYWKMGFHTLVLFHFYFFLFYQFPKSLPVFQHCLFQVFLLIFTYVSY